MTISKLIATFCDVLIRKKLILCYFEVASSQHIYCIFAYRHRGFVAVVPMSTLTSVIDTLHVSVHKVKGSGARLGGRRPHYSAVGRVHLKTFPEGATNTFLKLKVV